MPAESALDKSRTACTSLGKNWAGDLARSSVKRMKARLSSSKSGAREGRRFSSSVAITDSRSALSASVKTGGGVITTLTQNLESTVGTQLKSWMIGHGNHTKPSFVRSPNVVEWPAQLSSAEWLFCFSLYAD